MGKTKTKIAVISSSLAEGGAERFAGLLSIMLDGLGYEVHNIIINSGVDYDYKGMLHNLAEKDTNQNALFRKITKSLSLRKCLRENAIDIVIDNRPRNAFLRDVAARLIFGSRRVFYIVHSYNLKRYLPESVLLAKILYGKAEKLVCVSKAIEAKVRSVYGFKNTVTIYNPVDLPQAEKGIASNEKYLLFFGRLEEKVKNFSLMLEAFKISGAYKNGYVLKIMGTGPDEAFIKALVLQLGLQGLVQMLPFQKNPSSVVREAKFTLLTSHFEGFPMSVIESLALGTPVISVDCNSGPAEIIQNERNGLLVPNHDAKALANAISIFASAGNLYDICKKNAAPSIAHLSMENIATAWQQILSDAS